MNELKALQIIFSIVIRAHVIGQLFTKLASIPVNPNNVSGISLLIMFLILIAIPVKKEINVEAQCKLEIIQTTNVQYGILPSVRLLSKDEREKVVQFY